MERLWENIARTGTGEVTISTHDGCRNVFWNLFSGIRTLQVASSQNIRVEDPIDLDPGDVW